MSWFDRVKHFFSGSSPTVTPPPPEPTSGPFIVRDPSETARALFDEALAASANVRDLALIDARRERRRVAFTHLDTKGTQAFVYGRECVVRDGVWHEYGGYGIGVSANANEDELRRVSDEILATFLTYPERRADYVPLASRTWNEPSSQDGPFELASITNRFSPVSEDEVDEAERTLGFAFPPGYREFVTKYGEAVIQTFIRIRVPSTVIRELPTDRAQNEAFDLFRDDPTLDFEDRLDLVTIGTTVGGDTIVVHPGRPDAIFVLPHGVGRVRFAGRTLDQAFRYLCSGELAEPIPTPLVLPFEHPAAWRPGPTEAAYERTFDEVLQALLAVAPGDATVVRASDEDGEHAFIRIPSSEAQISIWGMEEPPAIDVLTFAPTPTADITAAKRALARLGYR